VGKECFISLGATLRTLRLCGFTSQTLAIASVLRPFNRRGTERTEDYGKIVGFLRQAHEPTENSDEPRMFIAALRSLSIDKCHGIASFSALATMRQPTGYHLPSL